MTREQSLRRARAWLLAFMFGLVVSGLTAFPLEREVRVLASVIGVTPDPPTAPESALQAWIRVVRRGIVDTNERYPFIAYGTDWLGFGHLVIALAFVGALRDPVRNRWLITFGLIACAGVIPLAAIAGRVRGIPFGWRLIDCSFAVFGAIPLLMARRHVARIEAMGAAS